MKYTEAFFRLSDAIRASFEAQGFEATNVKMAPFGSEYAIVIETKYDGRTKYINTIMVGVPEGDVAELWLLDIIKQACLAFGKRYEAL